MLNFGCLSDTQVEREVNTLVRTSYNRAVALLHEHHDKLEAIAEVCACVSVCGTVCEHVYLISVFLATCVHRKYMGGRYFKTRSLIVSNFLMFYSFHWITRGLKFETQILKCQSLLL